MDLKDKRQIVEEMLAKGDTMICLDSRNPQVQVPENHKGKEDLRLVLNLNFRHSITTQPDGIEAEMLFGGAPFLCWIPYESLWAVYNPQTGEGVLWPAQTPLSLRDLLGKNKPSLKGESTDKGVRGQGSGGRHRRPPSPKAAQSEGAASSSEAEKTAKKGRPRFRVIEGGKKD